MKEAVPLQQLRLEAWLIRLEGTVDYFQDPKFKLWH